MAVIFISYASEDTDYVEKLTERFRELGQTVVWDKNLVAAGSPLRVLQDAMAEADVFLPVISASFMKKANPMLELLSAKANQSLSNQLIVPLLIDNVEVPPVISMLIYATDFDRLIDDAALKVVASILHHERVREATEQRLNEVEADLSSFVDIALQQQGDLQTRNTKIGERWNLAGAIFLALGLVIVFLVGWGVFRNGEPTLSRAISGLVIDVVAVGILGALAKYSYSIGKSYISEGLKSSDRAHAIRFGQFYLKAYGGRLTPAEVKDAFQHWNIDRSSTFSQLDASHIDPQILSILGQVASAAMAKK
ncbi:toll/interleukin-1 receptor domain-containing protein [Rhizobium laguerreae]|uniref:toll/interleukin-1 receptor domain-containing protein n=1 Tax=Rhizobium laguerreae TaxID=1076926 RepID=UPI001C9058CB|nr:toll/interleukin-1 receptor domain-containing protein [Rhizobium laguerreae]MBY3320391.1 toll/interleukin-1 receptor domain-containing protein [Rhizobium laguerreae]MBY3361271.1 toll/interleukin-1 receptor domain-containing protein [Rhizobium laguerreae]